MAETSNLLNWLRTKTQVDCDTLDFEVASKLGPFVDCTSNQAIAYFELIKPKHAELVKASVEKARALHSKVEGVALEELAVQIATISLSLTIAPLLTGYVHIQANPFYAYSTDKIVEDAKRIVWLFKELDPNVDVSRICIKIPSTWEGLQACHILEASGIRTLATALFSMEQAALAGQAGCLYIAPYVNELKVHFDSSYHDQNKATGLCVCAQHYFNQHGINTKVLSASLTSIDEVLQLAGVNHITVPPAILQQLAVDSVDAAAAANKSMFSGPNAIRGDSYVPRNRVDDESVFRMAYTRDNDGVNEFKLIQAINIFCDMQLKLQQMMSGYMNQP